MFRHECRATTRGRRSFLFRTFVAALLGIVTPLVGLAVSEVHTPKALSARDRTRTLGGGVFFASTGVELVVLTFSVPAFIGGAIAKERQKETLPLLLLSRLTPLEIVLIKL